MNFLTSLKIDTFNKGVSTGTKWISAKGAKLNSYSPVDGKLIGSVSTCDKNTYDTVIHTAQKAFLEWR